MEIRSIDTKSIPSVATLLRRYWKEQGSVFTQKWVEQYVEQGRKLKIKKEQTFTLKEKEKIIGCISIIIWEGNIAELNDLVIKKEERGKDLGKKLIEHSMEWCRRNNTGKIFALIFYQQKALFEACSFNLEGFLKDHHKVGEHLLLMSHFPLKKKETQMDLKAKLEDMRKVKEIEKETAKRLRGLPT